MEATLLNRAFALAAQARGVSVEEMRSVVSWEGEVTLQALGERLGQVETRFTRAASGLEQLQGLGLDQSLDYLAYNRARTSVFDAQLAIYVLAVGLLRSVPGGSMVVSQLPVPSPGPTMRYEPARTADNYRRAVGLGATWVPVAIAVALIAAAAVVAAIVLPEALREAANIILALFDVHRFEQLIDGRLRCIQSGQSVEVCRGLIEEPVPLSRAPETGTPSTLPAWAWAAFGALGVVILGGGIWIAVRQSKTTERRDFGWDGLGAPTRVNDLDGSKSRYNLEIE